LFCDKPYIVHLVAVKNEDVLNDDASHFKLIRSVLKIASFKFVNLQYFNPTFMKLNITKLVLNVKCEIVVFRQCSRQRLFFDEQNIVHLAASTCIYMYMLTSNEEIPEI